MEPLENGYFRYIGRHAAAGLQYAYLLDGGEFPDPASRRQPQGVHQPSAVFWPDEYEWHDRDWGGVALDDLVLYELHVGTFTPAGTLDAIIPRLEELRQLGVTALELMPIAAFPGRRNWGYDGVYPRSVQDSYGGPAALQRFVDAAHGQDLAVVLDVVFNHLGPEGNYLQRYGPYFTERYHTPWGAAFNFDGPDSDAVRQFVIETARGWIRDFHVDGLRLDAIHAIYDFGARHVLEELQAAVQAEAARQNRTVHIIAESNRNDPRWVTDSREGGHGLDAVWNDDFHHALHAYLTGERDGYYCAYGSAADVVKAFNQAHVYDGQYNPYRRRRHGVPAGNCDRRRFVVSVQTHDQVGNRANADRWASLVSPTEQRLACALLLVSPFTPLLFMGEEYGETRPFPYFCSFGDPELAAAVRRGRRRDALVRGFSQAHDLLDPNKEQTFDRAVLSWDWLASSQQSGLRQLYCDLLAARRSWPGLRDRQTTEASLSADGQLLTIVRGSNQPVLVLANLSQHCLPLPPAIVERPWLLSTEAVRYGGVRDSQRDRATLLSHEVIVCTAAEDAW